MQHDPDNSAYSLAENLEVVKNYVHRTTHGEEGRPDRHDAIQALKALPDQIDWIERGIVEWRDVAQKHLKALHMEMAKTRVAISRLQTLLNGR